MHQSQQEETVSRTDEVATNAPAKSRRSRITGRRGWAAGLAALVSAIGVALVPAVGAPPAGAAAPTVTVVTGHLGASAPALGVPVAEGSAQVNPTYVAFNPTNGDTAIASTKAGSVFVYLIAGSSEANEYNIETNNTPVQNGTLTAGDVYVMAGTGTAGLIAQPGNNQFGNSVTAVAISNPIQPTSVAFDQNGNLLIAGEFTGASAIQVVAKTSGTFYGVSMTAGDLYTIADVGLSGSPSSAINMGNVAAPGNGLSVDGSGNIVVGDGDGVDFVNEQSTGSLSLYGLTIPHQSSAVVAGTAQGGSDCAAGAAHAPAKTLFFQSAAPFFDGSDNVYFSDNDGGANGGGCVWVLPAHSGNLDGMSVTAGNVYKLAGNGGSTPTSDGTAGVQANVAGTSQVTIDSAGNVVLAVQSGPSFGTSPAIQVLAETTGTFYGTSMTAGDVYTVAGGASNLLATLSGPTSVLNAGSGNLLFTDGASSSANLDELSGAPAAVPVVSAISPNSGPVAGGTSVTITSSVPNFTGATAVKFGATAATTFTVNSATQITATSPAGSAGTVDVTVTGSGGTSATSSADQFTYVPAPTVASVAPSSGPTAGGTSVTITGSNLGGATAVKFGTTTASVTNDVAGSITATSPAESAGTVDVTVTTPGGTSATSSNDQFTYVAAPTVTGVSPSAGPLAGGTSVTITGTNLSSATAVKFGTTIASVTNDVAGSITATSPAESAGTVDVTVTTAGGTSATSTNDQFTYEAAPTVTGVSPSAGPLAGGTSVTITGTGLAGATAVKFGTTTASVTNDSAGSITATSPAESAGTVDITVTTPGGTSTTSSADQFTYTTGPTVSGVVPNDGPLAGSTSVTISGSNLSGATAVKFGSTTASITNDSAGSITATSPAESAGTVDITVTTPGGTSPTSSADQFTYVAAPTVTNVTPNSGNIAGGTSVTITGTNLSGATAVKFGTTIASVTNDVAGSITATAPAGSEGTVDVTVTTPGGTSATSSADDFSYLTVPDAPTGANAVAGNAQATVSWTPPSNDGGATIASYTATSSPGGHTCSTSGTSCTVTGLTNGTAYTFTVTASNSQGPSSPSAPSNSVTPSAGPQPPAPPPGATQSNGAASDSPSGTATASLPGNSISASGTGVGAVTVAQYASDPTAGAVSGGTGVFYDVAVAPGTTWTTLTITVCSLGSGGESISWWNGSAWVPFSNQSFNSSTGCVTATVTGSTSPTLAQLTGTPIAATGPLSGGYWSVASDGGIFSYGDAQFYGSTGAMHLNKPIVGMAPTHDGKGYWLVASDGGIFSYGDAVFYGSTGAMHLNKPIVGMAVTADGKGYWLVASDGGIFNYGDAAFYGSTGAMTLNKPIVGMASTHDGLGYWLVASDGGIFNYGDAAFDGSAGAMHLNKPIVGMASTSDGLGYWLVASDGGIFNYGDAAFYGSTGAITLNKPIVGMAPTFDGKGYDLVASDGGIFNYGDAAFDGSAGGMPLNQPIVGMAAHPEGG
jgi:hypothetical protein